MIIGGLCNSAFADLTTPANDRVDGGAWPQTCAQSGRWVSAAGRACEHSDEKMPGCRRVELCLFGPVMLIYNVTDRPEHGKAEYASDLVRRDCTRGGGAALRYAAIIPTLNAADTLQRQVQAILEQSVPPDVIIVIDSGSDDGTAELAASMPGVRLMSVKRGTFDHGGTRDMAIRASDTPFVILLTQDALPADAHWAAAMLAPFGDERVAAVCGRQVARSDARAYEKAVRAFRYPDESIVWNSADLPGLGVRGYLLSDVCAAYCRRAYDAVGGFEHPIATNEDMLIAADLLNAGYCLAYSAGARVWHSHNHTLKQEYLRNRLIGEFLVRYGDRFAQAGETGEGLRLVRHVSKELVCQGNPGELLPFWLDCGARLLGNRAGKRRGRRKAKARSESNE